MYTPYLCMFTFRTNSGRLTLQLQIIYKRGLDLFGKINSGNRNESLKLSKQGKVDRGKQYPKLVNKG